MIGTRKLNSWKLILSLGMVPGQAVGVCARAAGGAAMTAAERPAAATAASAERSFTTLSLLCARPREGDPVQAAVTDELDHWPVRELLDHEVQVLCARVVQRGAEVLVRRRVAGRLQAHRGEDRA